MGVFAMCLFIAGKREDEALERCRMKRKEIHRPRRVHLFCETARERNYSVWQTGKALCRMPKMESGMYPPAIIWMPILP